MKRRILLICQMNGRMPQVIEDGDKIMSVYPLERKKEAKALVKDMNAELIKQPVHLRIGWIDLGKKVKA